MKELRISEQETFLLALSKLSIDKFIILYTALEAGLRLSELQCLKYDDVKGKDSIIVKSSKKRSSKDAYREVPISPNLKIMMDKYLAWFEKNNLEVHNPEKFLFFSRKRKQRTWRGVQQIALDFFNQIDMPGKSMHTLRHTFARNLVRKGVRLEIIQRLLGHASLGSTGVYLEPSRDELFEAINQNENQQNQPTTHSPKDKPTETSSCHK